MALSGSISKTVATYWRLSLSWTATQDVSANTSTITAKMYWEALDSYGVSSGATKSSGIQHDGGSWSVESKSGMASLSGHQKKLINTYTFTLSHNSDGTKSFSLDGYFKAEVTLRGTYYGSIDLDEKTFTLNTIPRESKLTSSASWQAGKSLPISISRYSSKFDHDIDIYVNNVKIKTVTGIGTSTTVNFSAGENEDIFRELAKNTSSYNQASKIVMRTMSGSTQIGSNTYTGTCSSPTATTVSGSSFTIGNSTSVSLTNEKNSAFVYDLTASIGSYTKTLLSKSTSLSVSWDTNSDKTSLLNQLPTSNSRTLTYTLTTYWKNGTSYTKVRNSTSNNVTAKVNTSTEKPTFSGGMTYADTNSKTTAVTGDNSYIIQGQSTLTVTLPSANLASASTGTTMKEYQCVVNGSTVIVAHPSTATNLTFTFSSSKLNASTNQTLTMKAVDKRGNYTAKTITVKFIPYSPPTLTSTALRDNSFDSNTKLTLRGNASPISIGGVNKNAIKSANYKYAEDGQSLPTTWTPFTGLTGLTSFTANVVTLNLDNSKSWNIQIYFADKLVGVYQNILVDVGRPIFFIDSKNRALGFNDMPANPNEILVNGRIRFGNTMWSSQAQGEGEAGALWMNNSDITGVNAMYFHDISQDYNGEGLMFLKSGATAGSPSPSDYDNLYARNGVLYFNGKPVTYQEDRIIWSGASFPNASTTLTMKRALSECPNGWILCWSDYDAAEKKYNDYNIVYTFIPKEHVVNLGYSGTGVYFSTPSTRTMTPNKYLYITDTTIKGNDDNAMSDSYADDVVLRYVLIW
ncbi:minor tail protein [Bacillus phage vB_BsuS_PJN02]|uniref:Minor tail protein n=1 Tax=Bacillus phage vB_BsuS_PJN02 TaxID=2920374 RepID=A0AC61TRS8_9CAUD|nr:tail protein [Bacillus phage vB_BsuS_PJN02]UNH58400.1 minor tail protein [Bacillus phage vB_BsuS_PJN02]